MAPRLALSRDRDYRKVIFGLFIIVVASWVVTEGLRVSRSYYNSQDDIYMGIVADHMKLEGLEPYWASARMYSHWQGRGYFYFSFFFFVLPFLTNSVLVRTAIIITVQLASIGAIGLLLGLYLGEVGGMVFVAGTLCLLPHWNTIHPITTHAVVYQMPLLCFFSGMSFYVCSRRRVSVGGTYPRACLLSALLLMLASLFFYELLIVPFFLIAAALVWAETTPDFTRLRAQAFIADFLPVVVLFVVWTVTYVVFRHLHPSTYEGAMLAPLDAGQWATDVSRHLISSLPGAHGLSPFAEKGRSSGILDYLTRDLGWGGLCITTVASIFISVAVLVGAKGSERQHWRLVFGSVTALALLTAVLAPAPIFLTAKYRNMPWESMPYLPGYYSYLAFMAILTTGIVALRLLDPFRLRMIAAGVLAVLLAAFSATANVADNRVTGRYSLGSKTWKAVDAWMETEDFKHLPENAVVLAPTLWERINPAWWFAEDYWSHYVLVRSGRNIRIVPTANEAFELGGGRQPVFYAEREWGFDSSVLLITSAVARQPDGHMKAKSVTVISSRDFPHPVLEYALDGASQLTSTPGLKQAGGSYSGSFSTPGMLVGTARLVGEDRSASEVVEFHVEFERGFSLLEERGRDYWRWSDGSSGEGVIAIENKLDRPAPVLFRTALMSGPHVKFAFCVQGGSRESFETSRDDDIYERSLILQPGRNEIWMKSYGPRKPALGDPRYLVFGMKDWAVAPK